MPRPLAFLILFALGLMVINSAGIALPGSDISFTLDVTHDHTQVRLTLSETGTGKQHRSSSDYPPSDLRGLNPNWAAGGPISFALVRDAGRMDCAGTARTARADGSCRFTADPGFADLLVAHGMARPTRDEAYTMTMVGARRSLLESLVAGHYAMPAIDDYIAMTALGVQPDTLRELAEIGYSRLKADEIIQMAALRIDPPFIRAFERIGYRNLSVEQLVQLRALNVTPTFVQMVQRDNLGHLSVDQLVQLKVVGVRPAVGKH